jgi:hypothetical protein
MRLRVPEVLISSNVLYRNKSKHRSLSIIAHPTPIVRANFRFGRLFHICHFSPTDRPPSQQKLAISPLSVPKQKSVVVQHPSVRFKDSRASHGIVPVRVDVAVVAFVAMMI